MIEQPGQVANLTIERLCWLASREHIDRRTRRLGVLGWLSLLGARDPGGARLGRSVRGDAAADRRRDYAVAVDAAAAELSADERLALRSTGQVPAWFFADIDRRVAELRHHR